jgi:hypothetical protein
MMVGTSGMIRGRPVFRAVLCYVSAHAPRMQRTLIELGFLPVAYLPALVFHDVERLDVVSAKALGVAATPPPGSTRVYRTVRNIRKTSATDR